MTCEEQQKMDFPTRGEAATQADSEEDRPGREGCADREVTRDGRGPVISALGLISTGRGDRDS